MKKFLYIVVFMFLCGVCVAQQYAPINDSATLRTKINEFIIPNLNGTISASKLNVLLNGIMNVMVNGSGNNLVSFSSGNLSPVFTTSVATSTSTPALSFLLSTAGAHKFLGNNTNSTTSPDYYSITTSDLPDLSSTYLPYTGASNNIDLGTHNITTQGAFNLYSSNFGAVVNITSLPNAGYAQKSFLTNNYLNFQSGNADDITSGISRPGNNQGVLQLKSAYANTNVGGLVNILGASGNGAQVTDAGYLRDATNNTLAATDNSDKVATTAWTKALNYVSKTSDNTYTAGTKQTFVANSTTAGLNIAGVTATPSSCIAGDIFYRGDAGTLHFYDGVAGTSRTLVTLQQSQVLLNKSLDFSTNIATNIPLTTAVVGALPIVNGGTNATTASAALTNILPPQAGNSGTSLTTDGTSASWQRPSSVSGIYAAYNNITVAASSNNYTSLSGSLKTTSFVSAVIVIPMDGVISNLTVFINSTQDATGTLVCTLYKAAASTPITITIPAGSPSGAYYDNSHTLSVTKGSRLALYFVNSATTASAQISAAAVTITY